MTNDKHYPLSAFEKLSLNSFDAGKYKHQQRQDYEEEEEIEYFEFASNDESNQILEVVGSSDGRHAQHIVIQPNVQSNAINPFIRCPYVISRAPNAINLRQSDCADEWISEFNAEEAYKERQEKDNPESLAEAAADLLAQMDFTDEKLRNSCFVAYLKELAKGRFDDIIGPNEDERNLERADFNNWNQIYQQSISHLVTEEEKNEWNEASKDWHKYDAYGLGYEGFAQREFTYIFAYADPSMSPFLKMTIHQLELAARNYMNNRNTSQAILAFEEMTHRNVDDHDTWIELARLQVENEQDILAIAAFQRALKLKPDNQEALLEMAGCLVNEGCRPEALDALSQWLKVHSNLSIIQVDPSLRIQEILRCCLQLSSDNALVNVALSVLYSLLGEYEQGLDALQLAEPLLNVRSQTMIRNRMGALLANSGNFIEALRIYDSIISVYPTMARVHYNRGISLFNVGDYEAAIMSFTNALQNQLIPNRSDVFMRPDVAEGLDHVWSMLRIACEMAQKAELAISAMEKDLKPFLN